MSSKTLNSSLKVKIATKNIKQNFQIYLEKLKKQLKMSVKAFIVISKC